MNLKMLACVSSLLLPVAATVGIAGVDLDSRPRMTLEGARKVLEAAKAEARRVQAPGGTIAVVDDGGHLLLLERPDGTAPVTPPIAIGKARTAALFRSPTSKFEQIIRDGRTPMLAIEGWTPMQGGVPIVVDGQVVGAVGVSGAASAPQDEEIAIAGAKALQGGGR
jgi:glc operon protein GlcG